MRKRFKTFAYNSIVATCLTEEAKDTGVVIEESKHLKFKRVLNGERMKTLKRLAFLTKIEQWFTPSPMVEEEAVVVKLKQRRERKVAGRPRVWHDVYHVDHRHSDIVRFKDLIAHKKAQGYEITVRDGVLAYMLVFKWGRKSVIAGFLQADMAFPEFKGKVNVEAVGSALSRLAQDDVIEVISTKFLREQLYRIERKGEGLPPPIRREAPPVEEHAGIIPSEFGREFIPPEKRRFIRYTLTPHKIEELEKKYGLHRETVTSPYYKRGLLSIEAPFIPRYVPPPLKETLYRIRREDLIQKARWWLIE